MNHEASRQAKRQHDIVDLGLAAALAHFDAGLLAGKNIFITGGTGFFGFWLLSTIHRLNRLGAGIHATVLSREPEHFLQRQPYWQTQQWLSLQRGNVRDFSFPTGHFDFIIHAATDTSEAAHNKPLALFTDIVDGTRRLLEFALHSGAKRVLLTSSGAVYGPQPDHVTHISENARFACASESANSAYGEGKRVMELLGALYQKQYGIESVIARCFAFVGPGLPLDAHFAIGNFIRDALHGEAIRVNGDGTPLRSYLYGADLATWLLTLLVLGKPAYPYNVGSDQAISIGDLAQTVRTALAPDKPCQIQQQPDLAGRLHRYVPAIDRSRHELKLDIWTSLPQAIEWTADYYRV